MPDEKKKQMIIKCPLCGIVISVNDFFKRIRSGKFHCANYRKCRGMTNKYIPVMADGNVNLFVIDHNDYFDISYEKRTAIEIENVNLNLIGFPDFVMEGNKCQMKVSTQK